MGFGGRACLQIWAFSGRLGSRPLAAFPSSGETNFRVKDAGRAIDNVLQVYRKDDTSIDETDGVSLAFADWRFNLRRSNTEPLVRLNIESRGGGEGLSAKVAGISALLGGTRA